MHRNQHSETLSVLQRRRPARTQTGRTAALLGSLLLALAVGPPTRAAEITYKIQQLVKAGDTVGGLRLTGPFSLSALNDRGQLAFVVGASAGGLARFSVTDGQIIPLVTSGGAGPDGQWPKTPSFNPLTSINQGGDVAFSLNGRGVYLWSAATQQYTAVATVGMPALDGLTFTTGALNSPSLNNHAEVAVGMAVIDAAGKTQRGVFLRDAEGKLLQVALPGQELPDGSKINQAFGVATLSDAGIVGFTASRLGITGFGAYLWEQGSVTPVALNGAPLPGGATITHVSLLRVNNANREVLVALHQSDSPAAAGLYRYSSGQLTPLLLPGQDLPEGGKLKTVREWMSSDAGLTANRHISRANERGQYAFIAQLEGGDVGVYLLDVDGKQSLILKTGMTTDLGPVTHINPTADAAGVGLNSQGQVVVSVRIANGPETLVLLTPPTP